MKKIILMMMALCAMAFVGCDKEDKGGGSLKVNGVNLVGTWALISYTVDYWDSETEWQEGGLVDCIIVITSDGEMKEYDCDNDEGYVFSNGYLYGCTMANFEPYWGAKISVENGGIYIGGIWSDVKADGNDIISLYYGDGSHDKYKRVKGFK